MTLPTSIAHCVFQMREVLVILLEGKTRHIPFYHRLKYVSGIAMERPTLRIDRQYHINLKKPTNMCEPSNS